MGEPMKDNDLVMLAISGLREEYNGLKSTLLARHPPISFNELHGLLSDHDYMINKPITTTATASPQVFATSTRNAIQSLQQLASQLGFQLNPIASQQPSPQAFYAS